jgi:hypothetical protein
MNECFCQPEKKLKTSLSTRLSYCTCPKDEIEPLIQLNCCKKYVHNSCFQTYMISRRNEYIYGSDWKTHKKKSINDCDTCPYCRKQPNISDIPSSNLEKIQVDTLNRYCHLFIVLFKIFGIIAFLTASFDLIFTNAYSKNKIINYCDTFDNKTNCIKELKATPVFILEYLISPALSTIGVFWGLLIAQWEFFWEFFAFVYDLQMIITNANIFISKYTSVDKYRDILAKKASKIKTIKIWSVILGILIIWQSAYIGWIVYYNGWYIHEHIPNTVEEIEKIIMTHAIVYCLCNVFMLITEMIAVLLAVGISCGIIGYTLYGFYKFLCIKAHTPPHRVQLIEIDVDQSYKKPKPMGVPNPTQVPTQVHIQVPTQVPTQVSTQEMDYYYCV